MLRRLGFATALVLVLSGCSKNPDGVTATGSLADLRATSAAVLEAAAE